MVNIYIVYKITDNFNVSSYPTLENCLFGDAKLTKNADIGKYGYSGYRIGFDRQGSFSSPGIGLGKNVVFRVDMSSSTKTDNRKIDILILGKGPTQGLKHTLSAGKLNSINFTQKNKKKFVRACIIIKKIVTYLLIAPKLLNLNQKTLKLLHIHYA